MSEDTKSGGGSANSGGRGPMREAFNRDNDLDSQIAALPPETRRKVEVLQELKGERLEAEHRAQQRSHGFRLMRTKVELLENYIRDQSERPPEVRADPTQDLVIINEQAERMVAEREAFYLRNIEREAEANIRQIIASARSGEDRSRQPDHDREPER
ncbi:hypothetical protein MWN34_10895 [Ancylobacter sp. 6x-1]|uniref:Uncharacterized protein n=1 Tax=Ancylobacter crimeensis TaxID=2579147 RepID=A0ABT0DBU9_9HYPH|nr:hypothetical protein [Ancylobacter crimeensis]MCK0197420.1 hypothetical protein [Ancylobacter crimeensis]